MKHSALDSANAPIKGLPPLLVAIVSLQILNLLEHSAFNIVWAGIVILSLVTRHAENFFVLMSCIVDSILICLLVVLHDSLER
jgi:hypothetical protein